MQAMTPTEISRYLRRSMYRFANSVLPPNPPVMDRLKLAQNAMDQQLVHMGKDLEAQRTMSQDPALTPSERMLAYLRVTELRSRITALKIRANSHHDQIVNVVANVKSLYLSDKVNSRPNENRNRYLRSKEGCREVVDLWLSQCCERLDKTATKDMVPSVDAYSHYSAWHRCVYPEDPVTSVAWGNVLNAHGLTTRAVWKTKRKSARDKGVVMRCRPFRIIRPPEVGLKNLSPTNIARIPGAIFPNGEKL